MSNCKVDVSHELCLASMRVKYLQVKVMSKMKKDIKSSKMTDSDDSIILLISLIQMILFILLF